MAANIAAQQSFADRFSDALRLFEAEGGNIHALADRIGEEARDLRRWADGTKMPAHVLVLLMGAMPRHLADRMIGASGLRLVARDVEGEQNVMLAISAASAFVSETTSRLADGEFCHRDRKATRQKAARLITELQPWAGE